MEHSPIKSEMNIIIVYAHPEPRSLNGSLKDMAVSFLESSGHEVQVSDLYAMDWKASANGHDFEHFDSDRRLFYMQDSARAYHHGTQTKDIETEQENILWADVIIFQFPFWWFTMPAILKGWVDRVFACGFAYGVGNMMRETMAVVTGRASSKINEPCFPSPLADGRVSMGRGE